MGNSFRSPLPRISPQWLSELRRLWTSVLQRVWGDSKRLTGRYNPRTNQLPGTGTSCQSTLPKPDSPNERTLSFDNSPTLELHSAIIIIIINPLTARVVGAPQTISKPVSSIFAVLHCPLGLGKLQACPFSDVVFPPILLSALSSSPFHCALQDSFGQT